MGKTINAGGAGPIQGKNSFQTHQGSCTQELTATGIACTSPVQTLVRPKASVGRVGRHEELQAIAAGGGSSSKRVAPCKLTMLLWAAHTGHE